MSKYLFIGAHIDDVDLSCAGTMAKLSGDGHEIHYLAFSDCNSSKLLGELRESSAILGVSKFLSLWYKRGFDVQQVSDDLYHHWQGYDFVFTHSDECCHTDHKIVAQASKRIFKGNLISYIQPWNSQHIDNYYVELSEDHLEKKLKAVACYKSQSHRHYTSPDFIRAWALHTGVRIGKRYAEGFKIERLIQ